MRFLVLLFLTAISGFGNAQTFDLFIGTYTGTGSKGIYVYRFNAANGKLHLLSHTDSSVVNPSFLALSSNGKYVYAVNETGRERPGTLSAFSYDKTNGRLSLINSQLTGGDDPCYVSVTKNNKWVTAANYSGGSVSVFPVSENGGLQSYTTLIQDTGSSANKDRQEKAHVHAVVFSPDEHFLFTPDLGTDKVMIYSVDQASQQLLTPANQPVSKSVPGNGPRHITFHPNRKFAYLVEELSGTVAVYSYNNGRLRFIQRVITHPQNYKGDIGSADIHLSPDGKFLYVSNRGNENTITIFSVDKVTGKVTLKGYKSSGGKTPRNFIIDPTGNFLLVANQNSDNIVVYKRDKQTGSLTAMGDSIKIPKPVCLKMSK